jgi:hypothetical protein
VPQVERFFILLLFVAHVYWLSFLLCQAHGTKEKRQHKTLCTSRKDKAEGRQGVMEERDGDEGQKKEDKPSSSCNVETSFALFSSLLCAVSLFLISLRVQILPDILASSSFSFHVS